MTTMQAVRPALELVGELPPLDVRPAFVSDSLCANRIRQSLHATRWARAAFAMGERFAARALPLLIEDPTAADMEFDSGNNAVVCYVRGTSESPSGPVTVTISRSYWPSEPTSPAYIDARWPEGSGARTGEVEPSMVPAYSEALVIATARAKRTGLLD